jgi:hypothetical protein
MLLEVLPKVQLDPELVAAVTVADDSNVFIRLSVDYSISVTVDPGTAESVAREIQEKINTELEWIKFERTPNAPEAVPC